MVNETEKLMGNFIGKWKTSTLPTNVGLVGFQYPLIRTILKTSETPYLPYFQPLWETNEKLKKIEKLLKEYSLYNTKYLLNRNGIYYFVYRLNKSTIYKKSLHTSNLTYAIILRIKIFNRLREVGVSDKDYQSHLSKNSLNIVAESEEEEKLLKEIEKAAIAKIKRLRRDHNVDIDSDEKRDTNTLKKLSDMYLEFREKTNTSDKMMTKFRQSVEYLIIFFGEKKKVKDINDKDANDFQLFLLSVPKHWKNKKDLKGKNLKALYDNKSKLLEQYEKQNLSTINEVLKKIRTMFNYFVDNTYVYKNPFNNLTKTVKRLDTEKREFKDKELRSYLIYLKNHNLMEEYRFIKFLLYSGLRRGEALTITTEDLDFEKSMIDIDGTKTKNAKRICIIHKDIIDDLKTQMKDKSDEDYLFFNEKLTLKYRDEKVGNKLNKYMKEAIGEKLKKVLDLHSLRKNYSQQIYLSDEFDDLSMKTLIGHSTKGDVTDTHYLRGKRNYKMLKEKLDRVDFTEFIPQ